MPYGDTSILPATAPWPEPRPRRSFGRFLPLAFATVLSFAAGVGSTFFYLQMAQDEIRVAEVPLIEADRAPTRIRPEGMDNAGATAAASLAVPQSPSGLPSAISSAMAMPPPVPAIDLPVQGVPPAPEIVPPARAEAIELPPVAEAPTVQPASAAIPEFLGLREPEARIQVASLRTREKALEELNRFKRVHAALVGEMDFEIQRLELGERGVFHRVISAPVAERAEAVELCAGLAERRGQCQVITLRPRAPAADTRVATAEPQVPEKPTEPMAAISSEVRAQLASLRTLEGATRELNRLARLYGGALASTELSVSRIDQGDRGVFYRILTAPLPSRDAAGEFCQRLNAGQGAGCVLIPQRSPSA